MFQHSHSIGTNLKPLVSSNYSHDLIVLIRHINRIVIANLLSMAKWKSRCVLNLGCSWRIGEGSKIKVMSDPWLRGDCKGWVSAPQNHCVYNLSVIILC
jgi:hypothetical protein